MPTLIFSRVGACPPCSPRAGAHALTASSSNFNPHETIIIIIIIIFIRTKSTNTEKQLTQQNRL